SGDAAGDNRVYPDESFGEKRESNNRKTVRT
ncbi:unnamed protein product, partial [marine sediment metagenome]